MDINKKQVLIQSCFLCDSKKLRLLWKEDCYLAFECKDCKVVFCPVFQDVNLYNESYFSQWYIRCRYKRKRYLKKLLRRIEILFDIKPGRVLDIGCGTGLLLEIMKEKSYKVIGIDTSFFAYKYCKDKKLEVSCCSLNNAEYAPSSFDIITLFDVIAHLRNPASYLREIRIILKDTGLLVIKTPYHPQIFFRLANLFRFTRKSKSMLHIPAQVFHFTPDSIKKLLSSNGFEALHIIKINDIPSFFISFSFKSIVIFLSQLFLKIFHYHDSMIVVARKRFPI